MNEPMECYFKPGIIHFMAYPDTMRGEGPILETLEKIALDPYFQVVEITWIKSPEVRAQALKLLNTAHLDIYYGAQPRLLTTGMNINDLDENARVEAVNNLKAGIDEAIEMEAKGFAFLSGRFEETTKEQSFQALLSSTRELCDYAKAKGGLRVVLEVFDYDLDKKSLIGPAGLAARFAKEMRAGGYDNFGLMVDLSHIPQLHETIEESIMPVREYIVHAHIGNAVIKPGMPCFGDQHPRFGFPHGENDVPEVVEFLRTLLKIGYLNTENPPVVSFEVKPFGDEPPDVVIANAKRVLNMAWAMV